MKARTLPPELSGALSRPAAMPAFLVAALLAMTVLPALAAPEDFVVEPAHTYPTFAVSHLGISTQRGRFERTKGSIVLDRPAGTGTIEVAIDASTVSTGNSKLDEVLRGEDFFNVARFPAMTFRARLTEFDGDVPKRASGELTLLGVTRPVDLTLVRFACTRLPFLVRLTCGADAVASLKRSAFGMEAYSGFVADEVRIEIQVEAVRQEPVSPPPASGG